MLSLTVTQDLLPLDLLNFYEYPFMILCFYLTTHTFGNSDAIIVPFACLPTYLL